MFASRFVFRYFWDLLGVGFHQLFLTNEGHPGSPPEKIRRWLRQGGFSVALLEGGGVWMPAQLTCPLSCPFRPFIFGPFGL